MDDISEKALGPWIHRAKNVLHSIADILVEDVFFPGLVISSTNLN